MILIHRNLSLSEILILIIIIMILIHRNLSLSVAIQSTVIITTLRGSIHQILVILSFLSCQDFIVEIPTILLFLIEPYPFRLRQAQGHGRQHKQDDQEILHHFCRNSASRTLLRQQLCI